MGRTKIEWATHTANFQAGCTFASEGCQGCYALAMSSRVQAAGVAQRYRGVTKRGKPRIISMSASISGRTSVQRDKGALRWTGAVRWDRDELAETFHQLRHSRKPRRTFVGSMTDLFHAGADEDMLDALAQQIRRTHRAFNERASHPKKPKAPSVIIILTKRPERLLAWQRQYFPEGLPRWVWVGVSVENQTCADKRVPVLIQVKTKGVRMLSCEPLLGPIHLRDEWISHLGWIIVGGESGSKARPMHPEWARALRTRCIETELPFFFKQWGEWAEHIGRSWRHRTSRIRTAHVRSQIDGVDAVTMSRIGKREAGTHLDAVLWQEIPTMPETP